MALTGLPLGFTRIPKIRGPQLIFPSAGMVCFLELDTGNGSFLLEDGVNSLQMEQCGQASPSPPPVGLTWTYRASLANGANTIAASPTAIIAPVSLTSAPQKIYRSVDTVTWTLISTSINASVSLDDVAYGSGVFIIPAGNNNIARSADDGLTWTSPSTPFVSHGINSAAYRSGTWLLLSGGSSASANYYAISTDGGLTWSLPGTFTCDSFDNSSVIADSTQFVALGSVSSVVSLSTSTDGISWTAHAAPPDILRNKRIASSGTIYISANASTTTVRVSSTVAGLASASDVPMPFTGADTGMESVCFGNYQGTTPIFFAFGNKGSVASSLDGGTTWQLGILNMPHVGEGTRSSIYGPGMFVALGQSSDICTYGPIPTVITIQSADNSTGPFGSGSGEGWAESDNATFPQITHAVGSVSPEPCFLGTAQIGMFCFIGGPNTINVFLLGTFAINYFTSVKFTDKHSVLETYLTSAATFDTTTYPGFSLWSWSALLNFPFTNGAFYSVTFN